MGEITTPTGDLIAEFRAAMRGRGKSLDGDAYQELQMLRKLLSNIANEYRKNLRKSEREVPADYYSVRNEKKEHLAALFDGRPWGTDIHDSSYVVRHACEFGVLIARSNSAIGAVALANAVDTDYLIEASDEVLPENWS